LDPKRRLPLADGGGSETPNACHSWMVFMENLKETMDEMDEALGVVTGTPGLTLW